GLRKVRRFHAESRRSPRRHRDRRSHRGLARIAPGRLLSDSVLHFSDNRFAALQEVARAEAGPGWRSNRARRKVIASRDRSRFRYAHIIHLIRMIHAFIDSAPRSGGTRLSTRGSRRSGDRSNHAATAPTVIPTKGSRRSGDRPNHAATAPKRPTAPPFRCAVGPLCFDCSASRRNNLPLFPRVRRCAGPPEIPPRGVPRSGLVSGRFPFRRSLATRSSNASPSLFTSARLQVPQPEGLRTRACP
ncbi:MAG: hypothetical protein RL354_1596, partial [Planctomycetota bacterium]